MVVPYQIGEVDLHKSKLSRQVVFSDIESGWMPFEGRLNCTLFK